MDFNSLPKPQSNSKTILRGDYFAKFTQFKFGTNRILIMYERADTVFECRI